MFAIGFAPSAFVDARAASDFDPGLLQRASGPRPGSLYFLEE